MAAARPSRPLRRQRAAVGGDLPALQMTMHAASLRLVRYRAKLRMPIAAIPPRRLLARQRIERATAPVRQ
jgi:hypothetical protein